MKNRKLIGGLIALIFAAGCQSGRNHTSETSVAPLPAREPTYTVELIPTPRLTPTSREGDKSNVVYSSNIVAVYLNTNGAGANLTNAPGGMRGSGTPGR
jgi:hypothetical protein